MNRFAFLLFLMVFSGFSQKKISVNTLETISLKADNIWNINNFGTLFYSSGNTIYKSEEQKLYNYSNIQLGNITQVDAFNPLKINLFYKNFNTIIILDNRLSEIFKIDFNALQPYKNVTHMSTGYENTIWIFNQDMQQLELFDFKTNKTRVSAMPVTSAVLDLDSNYNYVWLLTEDYLYTYNYFGSTISKVKNEGFLKISEDNGNLVIQTKEELFYLANNATQLQPIAVPGLLINQFLLTNQSLYIYSGEKLHHFQLKIK